METVSNLESLDTNTLKLILKNALEQKREIAQGDFIKFVKTVWPEFVEGKHHKIYAEKLNRIANGELKTYCQYATKTYKIRICVAFISGVLHG
tara:strand:- start:517 stop:795 length:279 start_codon:yes stop_codon:yes gene_type:complete